MKLLLFAPHPDDAEFALGGFLHLIKGLCEIVVVCVTDGSQWPPHAKNIVSIREKEQKRVAKELGYDVLFLKFKDAHTLEYLQELETSFKKILASQKPDYVLCNWINDFHTDHKNVSWVLHKFCKNIVCWEEYSSLGFTPRVYINISSVIDKKRYVLQMYQSQLDRVDEYDPISLNATRGKEVGFAYAETLSCSKKFFSVLNKLLPDVVWKS